LFKKRIEFLVKFKLNKTEAIAGLGSFLASMYIVVVNPLILSGAGMPFSAALTSTVLVCFFGCLSMGIYAKNPIIIAPGMGMNAFFTFYAVKTLGLSYQIALGAVFWAGVFFMLVSIFNIRESVLKAIPKSIRSALSAGIGVFICFVGLQNAGFIVDNPATLVSMHTFKDSKTILFIFGLLLTSFFIVKKYSGAIVYGIIISTLLAILIDKTSSDVKLVNYTGLISMPDFSLVGSLDLWGSLKFAVWPIIFIFGFTDMLDGISTILSLSETANLVDLEGNPKNMKKSLLADAFSTVTAGLLGSSPGTAYIESSVGISQGGRTGQTAIIAAFCFLPLMFFSPLLSLIPAVASSISLVLVGAFMMQPIKNIDWTDYEESIPAFITFAFIPLTYSITHGITFGLLFWTILKLAGKNRSDIQLTHIIINLLSILALCIS
jgi:adenine/guanine/hypoxanthine permease